ncbi:MAG TPA: cupin domain-containing protein [Jiangellaceae bacterium]
MTTSHWVRRAADVDYQPAGALAPESSGLSRWSCVDDGVPGAVHTGFGVCRLEPGGVVPSHVHSFEESVHVLEGEVVLQTPGTAVRLGEGDYGLVPVGVPHAWRNDGMAPVRWAEMLAPQPRERYGADTFRVPDLELSEPVSIDPRDPRTRSFGNIRPQHMDPSKQSQELLAVSASMRTALLVYGGVTVKMMVDSDLGAVLSTMFMVQYDPDGGASPHDHPFEETYLILDGDVDATFDGEAYRLKPGDVAWAGAGCQHSFAATGAPVRWLETQAPQPPGRHSYRFWRDWDYLAKALGEGNQR